MNKRFPAVRLSLALAAALAVTLGYVIVQARAQTTEDTAGSRAPRGRRSMGGPVHYATNFPGAAAAGQDSHALTVAPPGAVNQGPIGLRITEWLSFLINERNPTPRPGKDCRAFSLVKLLSNYLSKLSILLFGCSH